MFTTKQEIIAFAGAVTYMIAMAHADCNSTSKFENGYNATGSLSVPGPRVNDSYAASTWTWSRYMVDYPNLGSNTSTIWQTIGLQTSPLQNLSDPSLPYTGCVITLPILVASDTNNNVAQDNGTCNSVFSQACINDIISTVNQSAAALSKTPAGSADMFTCTQLLSNLSTSPSSPCHNGAEDSISSQFLPNNFTGYTNPSCTPVPNPGASNTTNPAFFSWQEGSTASNNYTFYDQVLLNPLPVIVATWLKYPGNATSGVSVGSSGSGNWAHTQLFCLPANQTESGSRNVTQAKAAVGAGSVGGVAGGMFGIVALAVMVTLL